jgi:hypothetical protein
VRWAHVQAQHLLNLPRGAVAIGEIITVFKKEQFQWRECYMSSKERSCNRESINSQKVRHSMHPETMDS